MKRMFGMMPVSEIKKEAHFFDKHNLSVIIQAGPNGWTVIYADGATDFKDVVATTEENFESAKKKAIDALGELSETVLDEPEDVEVCCEVEEE